MMYKKLFVASLFEAFGFAKSPFKIKDIYELIKLKKSNLSRMMRDAIVFKVEHEKRKKESANE